MSRKISVFFFFFSTLRSSAAAVFREVPSSAVAVCVRVSVPVRVCFFLVVRRCKEEVKVAGSREIKGSEEK